MRVNGEEYSTVIRESVTSDGIFAAPGVQLFYYFLTPREYK